MADIIDFPRGPTPGTWEDMEPAIRLKLSESDISADVIDWVCMDMAPRWRRMPARAPVQAEVPGDLAPLFGQVVDLMRQHSIDMLWMVINLELELYLTRHPPSGGGTKLKLVGT